MAKLTVRRTTAQRAGAWAVAVIGSLWTFTGVTGAIDDAGEAISDHPIGAIVLLAGIALLVWGYWHTILRLFGVVTTKTMERDLREWLDAEGYTVTKIGDFMYNVVGPKEPKVPLIVGRVEANPTRIEIVASAGFSDDDKAIMSGVPAAVMRGLFVQIHTLAMSASGRVAHIIEGANDPEKFRVVVISYVHDEDFEYRTFFPEVSLVRKTVLGAALIMSNAARTREEEQGSVVAEVIDEIPAEIPASFDQSASSDSSSSPDGSM